MGYDVPLNAVDFMLSSSVERIIMAVPNRIDLVQAAAARWPTEFAACGTGGTAGHAFVKKLAAFMAQQTIGTPEEGRWGNNGKRGNVGDLSDDSIAYKGAGVAIDRANGNAPMEIIDIAANAGLPNIAAAWQPALAGPGDVGAYVAPDMAELGAGGGTGGGTPRPGAGWDAKHATLLARFPAQTAPSREFVRRVAEQFAFSFPGEGWGCKSADPTRAPSDNVLARLFAGGVLTGYLIVPRPSEGNITTYDLRGQHYIPVSPQNHLDVPAGGGTPSPPATEVPYPGADESIWDRVGEQLFADFSAHGQAPNPGMFRWSARVCWSAANSIKRGEAPIPAIQAAITKHRGEWLAALTARP